MSRNEKQYKFDSKDLLTVDLLQGHFLTGEIPKNVWRLGEKKGSVYMRRDMVLAAKRNDPEGAKKCLEEYRDYCFGPHAHHTKAVERTMRKLGVRQLEKFQGQPDHIQRISARIIAVHDSSQEKDPLFV